MKYIIIIFFSTLLCTYCIYELSRWKGRGKPTKNSHKISVWFKNGKEI